MKKSFLSLAVLMFGLLFVGCTKADKTITDDLVFTNETSTEETSIDDANSTEAEDTTADAAEDLPTIDTDETTEETDQEPPTTGTNMGSTPPLTEDSPVMNPTAAVEDPQTSQVIFPNGGELLEVGKEYTIRWESEGIEAVDIMLMQEREEPVMIGSRILAYNGVLEWTPTAALLGGETFGQFTIGMIDSDTGKAHDTSDELFIVQIVESN